MAGRNYIFNSAASPQTGVGDGLGAWYRVIDNSSRVAPRKQADTETVSILITGSMNGVTIKPVVAHDITSPLRYANVQNAQDAGTMVDVSFTTVGAFNLELPSGVYFTLSISSSGSPLPSVVVTAMGEIEAA